MPFEYEALRAKAQNTLVDFLLAELALGVTFVRSAMNAAADNHVEEYERSKQNAVKITDTVSFRDQVTDGNAQNEIGTRLAELERLISTLVSPQNIFREAL
jgi:hypothetical protein